MPDENIEHVEHVEEACSDPRCVDGHVVMDLSDPEQLCEALEMTEELLMGGMFNVIELENEGREELAVERVAELGSYLMSLPHGFLVKALISATHTAAELFLIKLELEASLASVELPTEIPAGPVADAIDHFLAHPETGVVREVPARRAVKEAGDVAA